MYIVTTTLICATVYATLVAQETAAGSPNIVSRSQWEARAAKSQAPKLKLPAPYVIIHHSSGSSCKTQAACQLKVKSLQDNYMDKKNFRDIAFNFLVGEDKNVYEGCGWDKQGTHSAPFNNRSIGICIIGNYTDRTPDPAAFVALSKLISYGVRHGKIRNHYKLLGHRQTAITACPGNNLNTIMQSWPHWSQSE